MPTTYLITTPIGAGPILVRPEDRDTLPVVYHRGYTPARSVRCVEVDGKLYALRDDCPDEGLDVLDVAAAEAAEVALDAEIAALSPDARAKLAPGWEPIAARKATIDAAKDDADAKRAAADALLAERRP